MKNSIEGWFHSQTGNSAHWHAFENATIDVEWDRSPSKDDMNEIDKILKEFLGASKIVSIHEEDDEKRLSLLNHWPTVP